MPIIALPINTQTSNVRSGEHGDILRIQDIDPTFASLWDPQKNALLYRLMASMRKGAPVHDPTHTWFEDDKPPIYIELKSEMGASAGTKTNVEYDANVLVQNTMVVHEDTGEWFLIANDPEAESSHWKASFTRGYQNTTAGAALPIGTKLRVGPTALPEGADANKGITHQPTSAYNYATYFSESLGITDVQLNSRTINNVHMLEDQERITLLRMMEQMDTQLRLGKRNKTGTAPANIYTSNGFEQVASNSIALQGNELDWPYLNEQFNVMWDSYTGSSPEKVGLLGPALFDAINKAAYDKWNVKPAFESVLGAIVSQINLTSGGQMTLIRDNWGFQGNTKRGYLIDMNYVSLHEHGGMELQLRDISDPKSHTIRREAFGSILPVYKLPKMHGLITWTTD